MDFKDLLPPLHPFLVIAAGVANFAMAMWTLYAAPKSSAKNAFVHTGIAIAGYLTFFGLSGLSSNVNQAFGLGRIGEVFVHQISPAFYSFSVFLLDLKPQKYLARVVIPIGFCISIFVLNLPGHHVAHYWWGNFISIPLSSAKWQLTLYFIIFFGFVIISFINLYKSYRSTRDPMFKRQLLYIMFAFGVAYIGASDHLAWIGIDAYPFGYIPLTVFTFMMCYTAFKHRLMAVNIFFARIFVVVLIYSILFTLAIPVVDSITKILIEKHIEIRAIILILAFLIGISFSTGPFLYAHFIRDSFWLKGNLTTGLVHELKSPLANIASATDVLLSDNLKPRNPEKTNDYFRIIQNNVIRLEEFVQNLLNIAKIQDGTLAIDRKIFDLSKTTISEINHVGPTITDQRLILTTDLTPSSPFEGDEEKIRQCISNLLSNAIKFTREGTIHVSLKQNSSSLIFSIKDSGRGIPTEDIGKIFERFFHGKYSNKGAGLGLFITKAWVEAHGGKIWAESGGEGNGATVTFILPTT